MSEWPDVPLDDGARLRLEDRARADAAAGVYAEPHTEVRGSFAQKCLMATENRVYAAAHTQTSDAAPPTTGGTLPTAQANEAVGAAPEHDIDTLRCLYEETFGKPADRRKSAYTLTQELKL